MNEVPQQIRLQFKTRNLLILTAVIAAGTALIASQWGPLAAASGAIASMVAMTIVGIACLLPERHGRWLRPLAVLISGALSLAFGLWVRKNF